MDWYKSYRKHTDEELMASLQQGRPEAFDELYRRYSKRLLHFMFRMLNHDEEKAQDLLQDLFLKVVERPELFDTSRNFKTWVFTVAANLCRKSYRGPEFHSLSNDEYELGPPKEADQLIAPLDSRIFKKHLRKELLKLDEVHRATFVLRYQEGFKLAEIAEIMECSLGTVKSRLHYTTKKLATALMEFRPLHTK